MWAGLIGSRFLRSGPPTRTKGGRPPGGQLPRDERYWLTIGGGRALGETLAEAGVREMHEEAGIDVPAAALGEPLGTTVIRYAAFGLVPVTQYQTYFAVAVNDTEVSPEHQSLIERFGIDGHEWLTADELERRPERLADPAMPQLMRAAVAAVRGRADHG